jgi:hypothetical protein
MDLATRAADTAFADLICDDPQWLREEFDALIAACFGCPPAPPPAAPPRIPPRRGPRYPPSEPWTGQPPECGAGPHTEHGHNRQRSPPA